jgi:PAS domain S-box-containing protein
MWRETSEKLQAVYRSSPLGIIQLDRDLNVRLWSPAAERIYGWTEREMLGRPFSVTVPEEKRAEFKRLCERLFKGEEIRNIETWRWRKDGTRVDVFLSVVPLRNESGEITGLLGVVADVGKPSPPGPPI